MHATRAAVEEASSPAASSIDPLHRRARQAQAHEEEAIGNIVKRALEEPLRQILP